MMIIPLELSKEAGAGKMKYRRIISRITTWKIWTDIIKVRVSEGKNGGNLAI
jgi:hypothetical protein